MKINPSQFSKAMEIYKSQKASTTRSERKGQEARDEVVLSDKAKAFQLALKALQEDDGVDMAKVEMIRKQMEEGQYKVNPQELANKIVDDLLSRKRV
ncbi:MAG: flagellar biosynthesis anti-sigma factor FlgM [Clostridiales bacterium]|nr:flagellar biosynthesis anti-sigma factor FlgM [Clostridiales bacterium]